MTWRGKKKEEDEEGKEASTKQLEGQHATHPTHTHTHTQGRSSFFLHVVPRKTSAQTERNDTLKGEQLATTGSQGSTSLLFLLSWSPNQWRAEKTIPVSLLHWVRSYKTQCALYCQRFSHFCQVLPPPPLTTTASFRGNTEMLGAWGVHEPFRSQWHEWSHLFFSLLLRLPILLNYYKLCLLGCFQIF